MMVNAPRRRRAFAFMIEGFVMSLLLGLVLTVQIVLFGGAMGLANADPTATVGPAAVVGVILANAVGLLLVIALMSVYLIWATAKGGSFACKLMGIEIVDKDGNPPGWMPAIIRTLVNGFAWSFTGGLHLLAHFFTEDKGGIHDMAASTKVVARL